MGLFSATPQPADWIALARALGLSPFQPTAGYTQGMSFRQMKRALGVPAGPKPSFQHWLYGVRHGVEIIALIFDVGAGSSQTTYTGVAARIDPPLFLGLGLRGLGTLERLFGADRVLLGAPEVDDQLHLVGFDAARIAAFFAPHDGLGRSLCAKIINLRSLDVRASDSVVFLSKEGTEVNPAQIAQYADFAVDLARALAARRRHLPRPPGEEAQIRAWQRFADDERLAFDPERMKLKGESGPSAIEIALETEGQLVSTAMSVVFRRSIGAALLARRTRLPSFLQWLFTSDIKVGDPDFDRDFLVTGHPVDAVRAALSRPGLLGVLKHLAAHAREVQMTHAELFFRVHGASPSTRELADLVALGRAAGESLFSHFDAQGGPYR